MRSPRQSLKWLVCCGISILTLSFGTAVLRADECPGSASEIVTDRPDITNSSLVVPVGSLQAENGMDWTWWQATNALDATNTRLRLGIAHCIEFLVDVPSYFGSMSSSKPAGFSDTVLSVKRQFQAPLGFFLSATAGVAMPSGSAQISGRGYQPYLQFPWSHALADGWTLEGMITAVWLPSQPALNWMLEPTLSLERELGPSFDMFMEYVGLYDRQQPEQLVDGGRAWRFSRTQQLDFHIGVAINRGSTALNGRPVDRYFGIGYSLRLDSLFTVGPSSAP